MGRQRQRFIRGGVKTVEDNMNRFTRLFETYIYMSSQLQPVAAFAVLLQCVRR